MRRPNPEIFRAAIEASMRDEMVRILPTRSERERQAFLALSTDEMLARFFNWQSRLVHPHPRRVLRAMGFSDSPEFAKHEPNIRYLSGKIAAGIDVRPHLSEDVKLGYEPREKGENGADLDLLLNDWGIHHLHISRDVRTNGFVRRGDDLLFAIFRPRTAYLLTVQSHGAWAKSELVEAAIRTWPDDGLFLQLNGVIPERGIDPSRRSSFRKAGVNVPVGVDGNTFISAASLGLTTARTTLADTMRRDSLTRTIRQFVADHEVLLAPMRNQARALGMNWPKKPKLAIKWLPGETAWGFAMIEQETGVTQFIC